ncbi:MAG: hypothetical protein AAGD01_10495 [Acidobacteriota bacterium]
MVLLWLFAAAAAAEAGEGVSGGPSAASSAGSLSAAQQSNQGTQQKADGNERFDSPQFFIESVIVEGARRVTPELLISEADLEGGRVYSEAELRRAASRVDRLPFVQQADFALRKGSERGRYQLVVTVKEIRRFFFGADLVARLYDEAVVTSALETESSDSRAALLAGVRFFVGDYGVLHFAAGGSEPGFGYTRYRLFGRRALLHLSWAEQRCDQDSEVLGLGDGCYSTVFSQSLDPGLSRWFGTGDSETWRLELGWPLRRDDSLRLSARWRSSEQGNRARVVSPIFSTDSFSYEDLEHSRVDLNVVRDTTDDSVMPRRGDRLSAGISWRRLEADLTYRRFAFLTLPAPSFPAPGVPAPGAPAVDPLAEDILVLPRTETELWLLSASAGRFWPRGQRHVLSAALRVGIGSNQLRDYPRPPERDEPVSALELVDDSITVTQASVRLGHALELYTQRPRTWGRMRWETSVLWRRDGISPDLALRGRPEARWTLETGLAVSSSWGLFRFGFAYQDFTGVLR